ncbi:MAG: diguanylate cyclase [Deferribacterales bacterium]
MTLRKLTSLVLIPVFLLTFIAVCLFFHLTYRKTFRNVENKYIAQQMDILKSTTSKSIGRLRQTATDWGVWDDTYSFIQNRNQSYIKSNLVPATLMNINADAMYFTDTGMNVLYSLVSDSIADDKASIADTIKAKQAYIMDMYNDKEPFFFLRSVSSDEVYLAVFSKVTDSNMTLRPNGFIFLVQTLTNFIHSTYDISGYSLLMHNTAPGRTLDRSEIFTPSFTEDSQTISLNLMSPIINSADNLTLIFRLNRDIFLYADKMLYTAIGVIMLIFIAAAATVTILMNVFVLKKVRTLTTGFKTIKDSPDHDFRLPESGVHELRVLANTANRSMDDIRCLNKKLLMMTNIDGLTGIPNRRFFNQIMDKELKRAVRNGFELSVLMLDIDYFKSFNDAYGHIGGDECLKTVAQSITSMLQRPADFAARFGGEEFIILLPETSKEGSRHIAESIRKSVLETPIMINENEQPVFVTVSIGISTSVPDKKTRKESLIENADIALYNAKKDRNCTVHFGEWK